MKIAILGTGYVGLVSGTCFAELGNTVTCFDVAEAKIASLKNGVSPIYEPGLEEMMHANVEAGRLRFSTDLADSLDGARIAFLAVGTPPAPDGSADLTYIKDAATSIARTVTHDIIITTKSTVPVGTADLIRDIVKREHTGGHAITVASNPEFLREGAAIKDFLNPDRVVVGVDAKEDEAVFRDLYRAVTRAERPLIIMDTKSAELTKYAANAFLATKISFINEMAALAEAAGADISPIAYGMGLDGRIGSRFLHAGIGYGGSCFPKDVRALEQTAKSHGVEFGLLTEVEKTNARQKELPLRFLETTFPSLEGLTVAVWGLSFKPRTDDVRESPALAIIPKLLAGGATVKAYDPKAEHEARKLLPDGVEYAGGALAACTDADALLVLTEWDEFRNVDLAEVKAAMRGDALFDGRNIYFKDRATEAGFTYKGVGR